MRIPLLGICAGVESAPAVAQAGADYLEVSVQSFLAPAEDEAHFVALLRAASAQSCSIRCANLFLPGTLPCVGETVDEPALLAYAETAFARAARVGIKCIVFGSGAARKIPTGFSRARADEQFVGFLKSIAPLAEHAGVAIAIEPLNAGECNFINTLQEAAEAAKAWGKPGIGLVADTYHMGFANEGPDTLRTIGEHLLHFHVAEHPYRRFPGADGQSYRAYFEVLGEIDYQGDISVECRWEHFAEESKQAITNLRHDLAAAGYPR
jgi:sugar phosphate isomerase/epimerase